MSIARPAPHRAAVAGFALAFAALAAPARADIGLIVNGGFESGFAGWTRAQQLGSEGEFFLQTGTSSPLTSFPVPAPPEGAFAAMTDAEGPGARVLYQDFVVPADAVGGILRFSLFVGNRADEFFTPDTLDFATPTLNQQARVDILRPGADPFSLSASDLLQNLYRTLATDPLVSGYTDYAIDIGPLLAANVGQTLRLRFAQTDNVNLFQFGVDGVSLSAVVPEPSSLVLLFVGGLAAAGLLRRRRA